MSMKITVILLYIVLEKLADISEVLISSIIMVISRVLLYWRY